jgi:RNA polymerase sigma factor (sigma-70 family)
LFDAAGGREVPINQNAPDGAVVTRVRSGDRAAFAVLVRRHADAARRTAAVLGAGSDTDDVVQEAFVKAYRALGSFKDGAEFRPWLLRIVANETSNARRAAGRRVARESAGSDLLPPLGSVAEVGETAALHEDLELFRVRVAGLPDGQRLVVACRFLLDLDEAQTAQVLGISRGTVKSRTHRALARLRAAMDAEQPGEGVRHG